MSKRRIDFAHPLVRDAMIGKPHRHDILREITEKVLGLPKGAGVARPGKTAMERARRDRKGH